MKYFTNLSAFAMEKWYKQIKNETINSVFIPITELECKYLLTYGEFAEFFTDYPEVKDKDIRLKIKFDLLYKVNKILYQFNNKAFFRLSTRSPKDSYQFYKKKGLIESFDDILRDFIDSERMIEDILEYLKNNQQVYFVLREWQDIKQWEEFRLFIINKKLKGISQYFYRNYFEELVNNIQYYKSNLIKYYNNIKEIIPFTDYILDIVFINNQPKILEINPFAKDTDPCLFNWESNNFKRFNFKYIKKPFPKEKESDLIKILLEDKNE